MSTRLCSFFVFVVVAGWLPAVAAGSVHNCGGAAAAALLAASSADNAAARVRAPAALAAPVFKHPWVQENVAVTFNAAVTKDGLGSQVHRLFGARAVAACTGLPFIHTSGFTRFAHLNGSASRHAAARVNTMLGLPMQPVAANASRHVVQLGRDCAVTWDTLAADTRAALAARRPTLFNISFTYGFALTHPGMLACVPVFRQHSPAACASNALMRPIRVAVHIRAGDAENDGRRLLPHAYFFAIIRAITKVCSSSCSSALSEGAQRTGEGDPGPGGTNHSRCSFCPLASTCPPWMCVYVCAPARPPRPLRPSAHACLGTPYHCYRSCGGFAVTTSWRFIPRRSTASRMPPTAPITASAAPAIGRRCRPTSDPTCCCLPTWTSCGASGRWRLPTCLCTASRPSA